MDTAFVILGGLWSKNSGLIEQVSRRGMRPLVIDEMDERTQRELRVMQGLPTHPLRLMHEHQLLTDVTISAVLDVVRQWESRYEIRGMWTMREEFVEAGGVCADYLGLPGPGLTATRVCRDKRLQRAYLRAWSPANRTVHAGDDASAVPSVDGFPVVVKPVDRLGSLGVSVCRDARSLSAALANHPPGTPLLVEELVRGIEVSVETLVQDGRPVFTNVTRKQTTQPDGDHCVELSHTIGPDILPAPIVAALLAANSEILSRLRFHTGLAHAEYMVEPSTRVRLMEVAARNPGDSILPLYHLATGAPIEPVLVDLATGRPAAYRPVARYARQRYLAHPTGVLRHVEVPETSGVAPVWLRETSVRPTVRAGQPDDAPAVREILIEKSRGQLLGELRSSMDRCLSVLLDAPTLAALDQLDAAVTGAISIQVDPAVLAVAR